MAIFLYKRRLLNELQVSDSLSDISSGKNSTQSISLELSNADGYFSTLLNSGYEFRGKGVKLSQIELIQPNGRKCWRRPNLHSTNHLTIWWLPLLLIPLIWDQVGETQFAGCHIGEKFQLAEILHTQRSEGPRPSIRPRPSP